MENQATYPRQEFSGVPPPLGRTWFCVHLYFETADFKIRIRVDETLDLKGRIYLLIELREQGGWASFAYSSERVKKNKEFQRAVHTTALCGIMPMLQIQLIHPKDILVIIF